MPTLFEHWNIPAIQWYAHGNGYAVVYSAWGYSAGAVYYDVYQTIIAESNHNITSVKLALKYLSRDGFSNVTVAIKEFDIAHHPTGAILATKTIKLYSYIVLIN